LDLDEMIFISAGDDGDYASELRYVLIRSSE